MLIRQINTLAQFSTLVESSPRLPLTNPFFLTSFSNRGRGKALVNISARLSLLPTLVVLMSILDSKNSAEWSKIAESCSRSHGVRKRTRRFSWSYLSCRPALQLPHARRCWWIICVNSLQTIEVIDPSRYGDSIDLNDAGSFEHRYPPNIALQMYNISTLKRPRLLQLRILTLHDDTPHSGRNFLLMDSRPDLPTFCLF